MFGGQLDTFLIAFRLSPSAAANSGRTARLVCTLLFFSSLAMIVFSEGEMGYASLPFLRHSILPFKGGTKLLHFLSPQL